VARHFRHLSQQSCEHLAVARCEWQRLASHDRSRADPDSEAEKAAPTPRCPCCGGRMIVIETFEGVRPARSPSPNRIRIDTC